MTEPKNQNLKPFSKNQEGEDEGMGSGSVKTSIGKSHKAKEEKEGPQYKLTTADAIIDGTKYSTHFMDDHGGHYGIFTMSPERVAEFASQGIMLVELE